jgi:hypothetical protein
MSELDSFDADCGICRTLKGAAPDSILFRNELWRVCAIDPPTGVPGWMMLMTRRHVSGPAAFDDREASALCAPMRKP